MQNKKVFVHGDLSNKGFPVIFRDCCFCGKNYRAIGIARQTSKNGACSEKCMILFMQKNAARFNCLKCGKEKQQTPFMIRRYKRKFCSIKCHLETVKEEALKRHKGLKPREADAAERRSAKAIAWRKAIFQRDNYTCLSCGTKGGYIEADHIKPWAFFKDLRYELSNGRTLCRTCHDKTKIAYTEMRKLYQDQDIKVRQKVV